MIQIGIDPAFRKNGFAICIIDEDKDVRAIRFKSFLDFLSWLWVDGEAPLKAVVVVENSNLQKKTFDMSGNKSVVARKSRNVGANQAISQAAYDAVSCKYGETAFEVSPKQKGAKWNLDKFFNVLKSEGHTFLMTKKTISQDEIDAYQLAMMGRKLQMFRAAKIRV